MMRTEDVLQNAIVQYLRAALPKAIIFSLPNEGKRTPQTAVAMKRRGMLPGMPDLGIVIDGGKIFFLEVKTAKGRLSPEQQAIGLAMLARSIPRATVRSIDDVQVCLREWRLS